MGFLYSDVGQVLTSEQPAILLELYSLEMAMDVSSPVIELSFVAIQTLGFI